MKRKIIAMCIIVEVLLINSLNVISYAIEYNDDDIVFFKSIELKNFLVKNYDRNDDGELSAKEMENVEQIEITTQNISDLTGMEYAINLQSISFNNIKGWSNKTINLSPLTNLPNLKELNLNHFRILDIENLYKLINLTNLSISQDKQNKISMYELSKLTNLEQLTLWSHNIDDIDEIDVFSNFKKLEKLDLVTPISDLEGISHLENLKYLRVDNINENTITDISSLLYLKNLEYLKLACNISDISVLSNLTKLQYLNLSSNKIRDISPLINLTNLQCLDISYNQISDISILEIIQDTCEIYADGQNINIDIGDIKQDTKIEYDLPPIISQIFTNKSVFKQYYKLELNSDTNSYVDDTNTKIILDTTIRGNKNIDMTIVNTSGNSILELEIKYTVRANGDSINEIEFNDENLKNALLNNYNIDTDNKITEYDMKNIESLDLSGLNIQDLTGLEHATNLTSLYLSYNSITDINPLRNLTGLKILYLSNNKISNINALENLTNLESLYIRDNKISDIKVLLKLNLMNYDYIANQQLELNLGDIEKNSVKEIELPMIFKQYINYDNGLCIEYFDNDFVNIKETTIILNTKNAGNNCTDVYISSSYGPLVNLKITYNVLFDKGDLNGDGKVNIKDWNKMYNYINETSELTEEEFERGDVNEDGKVNIKDWNRMYDHITEVNPLF